MLQRAITGAVFVVVLVTAILFSFWSLSALFFTITVIGLDEFIKLRKDRFPGMSKWMIFWTGTATFLLLFFHAPLFTHHFRSLFDFRFDYSESITLLGIVLIVLPPLILDLIDFRKSKFRHLKENLFASLLIGVPFGLIPHFASTDFEGNYNGKVILVFFILIWTNDTFAYLSGKFLGRNKLWERISPNKTWEGFFGGILFTQIVFQVMNHFYFPATFPLALQIGIPLIVSVFGTAGDLFESSLKRKAGVKDSGSLMPGHGGVLDRFDGILFSLPLIYFILNYL